LNVQGKEEQSGDHGSPLGLCQKKIYSFIERIQTKHFSGAWTSLALTRDSIHRRRKDLHITNLYDDNPLGWGSDTQA
jgi:hypothetical protein